MQTIQIVHRAIHTPLSFNTPLEQFSDMSVAELQAILAVDIDDIHAFTTSS